MSDPVIIVPPTNPPVIVTPPGGGGTASTNVIVGATSVGPQGPQGEKGDTGNTGATGATGPANVLSIGSVTGGSTAAATITGTSPEQQLSLVLPQGETGEPGIVASSSAPDPTTVVYWADTTEPGYEAVPPGGLAGQLLKKNTDADYDYGWGSQGVTELTINSPLTGGTITSTGAIGIQDASTLQKGAVQLTDATNSTSVITAATPKSVKAAYDLAVAAAPLAGAEFTGAVLAPTINATNATVSATATASTDVVNKAYVDNAIAGLSWKQSANLLATNNISLTGATNTLVIDGHSALTQAHGNGYRLLLIGQSISADNGIYVYSDNGTLYTLTRSSDADTYQEIIGASVFIEEGSLYAKTAWLQSNHYLTSFSGQVWTQFAAPTIYNGTNGVSVSGNTISATSVSASRITTSGGIDLATVTQSNTSNTSGTTTFVTSVSTDDYGRITGQTTNNISAASDIVAGIASFNSANFLVSGGAVSAKSISLTQGSGITLSTTAVNLGASLTISNAGVLSINGSTGAITNVAKLDTSNVFSGAVTVPSLTASSAVVSIASTNSVGVVVKPSGTVSATILTASPSFFGNPAQTLYTIVSNPGFKPGDLITIANVSGATSGSFNGTYQIISYYSGTTSLIVSNTVTGTAVITGASSMSGAATTGNLLEFQGNNSNIIAKIDSVGSITASSATFSATLTASGTITGASFSGAGTGLTSIPASAVTNTAVTQVDLLASMFGYPSNGYDTFPRHNLFTTQTLANGQIYTTLFTPIKTITGVKKLGSQCSAGRLSVAPTSSVRQMILYSVTNPTTSSPTLTPIGVTWDQDTLLWNSNNNAPGTTATNVSGTATTTGNGYTYVTCTCTAMTAAFSPGQTVTITGTAGSPGFTVFTGTVVGTPSTTSFILQTVGSAVVTGTMTAGTATPAQLNMSTSTATLSAGTIASGTGTVATVNITCSAMANPFYAGQWVDITTATAGGGTYIAGGVVTTTNMTTSSTSFTIKIASTATSGNLFTGTAYAWCPDSYGKYVRPMYTPTASGTGMTSPVSLTLTAGTTYAVGFFDYTTGSATYWGPTLNSIGSGALGQYLPMVGGGIAAQTVVSTSSITISANTSAAIWGRVTQ